MEIKNIIQFCLVKRMIRGLGTFKFLTYSQTLNGQVFHITLFVCEKK